MAIDLPSNKLPNPNYYSLMAGVRLHRVHSHKYLGNNFNVRKDVEGRFNPIFDSNGDVVPVLYATNSFDSAVCETIFHDVSSTLREKIVRKFLVINRNHSILKPSQDLSLVSLRNQDLKKWGISRNELISSSPETYCRTVKWAQEIYSQFDTAQGLVWTSNQCDPDSAYMFFGDRIPKNCFEVVEVRKGENDKVFFKEVTEIGKRSNTTIID